MGEPVIATLLNATLPISQVPSIMKVTVEPDLDNTSGSASLVGVPLIVRWPVTPGAIGFNIFVSPSPTQRNFFKNVAAVDPLTNQFIVSASFVPDIAIPLDIVWHFWIQIDFGGGILKFIQDEPAFIEENGAFNGEVLSPESNELILDNGDMKNKIEEIRRRHKATLENDGEAFFLYLRRWVGTPCQKCQTEGTGNAGQGTGKPIDALSGEPFEAAVTSGDPDYQGTYECEFCFGTGIMGGYFPKISIIARYGEIPLRLIRYMKGGLEVSQDFNSWTLWFPRLHEHDLLVRKRTGERYRVTNIGNPTWRGITTFQKFNQVFIPQTDIVYKLTDSAIMNGVDVSSEYDSARFDWSLFS